MAADRRDVFRSILERLRSVLVATFSETLVVDGLAEDVKTKARWYEFSLVSLSPTNVRPDAQMETGVVRIVCQSREGPLGTTVALDTPWLMVDRVRTALNRVDVLVKDYASGSGTSNVGCAAFKEVQVDDVGANEKLRTVLCTAEFLLSAAA